MYESIFTNYIFNRKKMKSSDFMDKICCSSYKTTFNQEGLSMKCKYCLKIKKSSVNHQSEDNQCFKYA